MTYGGLDLEPPADLTQALAHACQADAGRSAKVGGSVAQAANAAAYLGHAFAGVLDGQHGVPPVRGALAIETDERRLTPRMTRDIAERFLHDTEKDELRLRREPVALGRDFEVDRNTSAIRE